MNEPAIAGGRGPRGSAYASRAVRNLIDLIENTALTDDVLRFAVDKGALVARFGSRSLSRPKTQSGDRPKAPTFAPVSAKPAPAVTPPAPGPRPPMAPRQRWSQWPYWSHW
jgi:hypothetical protein